MESITEERMATPKELRLLEGYVGITLKALLEDRPSIESLTRTTAFIVSEDDEAIMNSGVADVLRGYFANQHLDPNKAANALATSGMGVSEVERLIKAMANKAASGMKSISRMKIGKRAEALIKALNDPSLFNVWMSGSTNPDVRGYQPPMV